MKILRAALLFAFAAVIAPQALHADAFTRWWPQFRIAAANSDAKAVAEGVHFPLPWENGKIRDIKTQADFTQNFIRYFTPEIQKIVATKRPERLPNGIYSITWKARGNEYSIYFKPGAAGAYILDGLSEGPP
jgi:hypothetical protein